MLGVVDHVVVVQRTEVYQLDRQTTLDHLGAHVAADIATDRRGRHDQGRSQPLSAGMDEVAGNFGKKGVRRGDGVRQGLLDQADGLFQPRKMQLLHDVHSWREYASRCVCCHSEDFVAKIGRALLRNSGAAGTLAARRPSMFERFTDRARRVLVLAQEEARLLNHNFIGTEHILLGLIHEGEGVAAKALESLGVSLEAVREKVEETIGPAGSSTTGSPPTSLSDTRSVTSSPQTGLT